MKKIFFTGKGWLLILLVGFVPLMWFKNGLLIAGGDEYVLLDPGAFTNFFRYAWNIKLPNAGGVIFSIPRLIPMLYFWTFFQSIGLSLVTIEKLWAVLLFVLPGLSMYYLVSQIYNKMWAKIIASTLYMFNLFLVVATPFQTNIKPVLIALPLMLAFFIKGLSNKKQGFLKYSVLIGLCSLLYAGSNVNLPTVAIVPFILFLYLIFYLVVERKEFLRALKFTLATVGCYIFLNLWWIANFLTDVIQQAGIVREGATFSPVGTTGMVDFFRFLGCWAWRIGHYKLPYFPYAHFYDEPFLLLLSFSIPILAFVAILLKPKDKNICFFSLLAIVGLFLAKGTAAPFGFLYQWMWKNFPVFWIFREPFSKFTPITILAYSVLLGFSVDLLYQKARHYLLPIMTIIVILIVSYPLLTGEVFWDKWNGSMRSIHVRVPQYWQEMKEYLINNNLEEERLLTFPASRYGMAYNWQHGFSSADDAAVALLPNPTIRYSSSLLDKSSLVANQLFDKLLDRNFNLKNYLSLLNVQYVLQENDADWRYSGGGMLPPSKSNGRLQESGLAKVAEFGEFTPNYLAKIPNSEPNRGLYDELYREITNQPALILYKMDDKYFLPHFYILQNIIYSSGGIESLANIVSFEDYEVRTGIYLEDSNLESGGVLERAGEIFLEGEAAKPASLSPSLEPEWAEGWAWPEANAQPGSWMYPLVQLKERWAEWWARAPLEKADVLLWHGAKRSEELWRFKSIPSAEVKKLENLYLKKVGGAMEILKAVPEEERDDKFWGMVGKVLGYVERAETRVKELPEIMEIGELHGEFRWWVDGIIELRCSKGTFCYEVGIPVEGDYEVLIGEKVELLKTGILVVGKENLEPERPLRGSWLSFGKIRFGEGEQILEVAAPEVRKVRDENLVDEGGWVREEQILYTPLAKWMPDEKYQISFDYRLREGTGLAVGVAEREVSGETYLAQKVGEIMGADGDDVRWRHFEGMAEASHSAKEALIYMGSDRRGVLESAEFKNVVVKREVGLRLILRKLENSKTAEIEEIPKITFVKVNPTKYRVKVVGATEPYTLVFSESFHKGWRLYKKGEGDPIDADHLTVNGYANSWYIEPEDVGGAEDYELTVEFAPQRLFYAVLCISGLTLIVCAGYLVLVGVRRRKNHEGN